MKKRYFLFLTAILTYLALSVSVVLAEDVLVQLRLDKTTTKGLGSNGTQSFEPVRFSLVIQNLSDKQQLVSPRMVYNFSLQKLEPWVTGLDPRRASYYPIVATGQMKAIGQRYGPYLTIEPHTELVIGYGTLPDDIKQYADNYKGHLIPGVYNLWVSFPTGLTGTSDSTSVSTLLFVAKE
ncbi:MAG: hypothetical protein Q7K98_04520 [Candidatus Omnitrophota bacterium]|nr:hypothetical protein [Candidatus Omnitrophota bacterium]